MSAVEPPIIQPRPMIRRASQASAVGSAIMVSVRSTPSNARSVLDCEKFGLGISNRFA